MISARLLAARKKESGAWLTAPPVSSVGLKMDSESIRVAVGLQLGGALCVEHPCQLCGSHVDESGTHGLNCRWSLGRIPHHTELNVIIQRALSPVHIPSTLEPQGLFCTDGRRPDGLSLIPWSRGRALVWDATCHDTFAPSYPHLSSAKAGAVAEEAAVAKRRQNREICATHCFMDVIKDLLVQSHDPLSYLKLCQRISVSIQRLNCVSVLGFCVR